MSEVQQTTPTPEAEPSYKRAARLIREKFAALGILATFRAPVPKVQPAPKSTPGEYNKPQPWAHVVFPVMFTRPPRVAAFSQKYKIGTGLAPWKAPKVKAAARLSWGPFGGTNSGGVFYVAQRESLGKSANRYAPHIEAEAAAIACKLAKWAPDPAEIFAHICREGFETRDVAFEDWAWDLGFDTDSREAERIFEACRASWVNALRLVSAADAEEFAMLAGEL